VTLTWRPVTPTIRLVTVLPWTGTVFKVDALLVAVVELLVAVLVLLELEPQAAIAPALSTTAPIEISLLGIVRSFPVSRPG